MDTVGAFSYLQASLPALISRITDLAAHTSAKHTEYKAVRLDQTRNPSKIDKSIVKAKCSMGSIQCSGRKRREDEDLSISRNYHFTLMNKRHKVIIEYDGHTQKVLEEVVRDIGICRSNIRRAKRSTMQTRFLPKTRDKTFCLVNHQLGESNQPQAVTSNLVRRIETGSGMIGVFGSPQAQKKSVIDLADKELQLVHGLCETAAYQALRTGDCVSEIHKAANNLKKLLTTANNEVRRLTEQKLQRTTEEETSANAHFTSTAARPARVAAVAMREPSTVGTSIIEVDEASYLSAESLNRLEFLS